MADWFLVTCLKQLRTEFDALSPNRDTGADGSIGDAAHQAESTSDHNPDSQGRVLAIDIDTTGPWPTAGGLLTYVNYILGRCRSGAENRLEYVIYQGKIYSRNTSTPWSRQSYSGASQHFDHAHFSARHDHTGNTSGSSWGLTEEFDVALTPDDLGNIAAAVWAAKFNSSGSITANSRLADIAAGTAALQVTAQGILANVTADDGDLAAIKADALTKYNGIVGEINQVDDEVFARISDPATPDEQVAAALVSLLGSRKDAVVALMQ